MDTKASEFVVALDIGSARTRCLIAEIADDRIRITGRGEEVSRGVRRGEVIDLAAASYATVRAIRTAEEQAGVDVQTLFLAAGSRHARFFNNRACVGITREERTITERDVIAVNAAARQVPLRDDAVTIASLISSYAVDDVRHVQDPDGMYGTRLEAEVHIVTDARSTVENLASCIDAERRAVEEFVFGPYAAAEAVLEDDEKKLGAAVVDIGAGTTGIFLYRDLAPVFSSVVPVGGDHITNDIAVGMDLSLADAARLKEDHGTVRPGRPEHPLTFQRLAKADAFAVDPRRLYAVIDCRAREILNIVRRELMRAGVRPASIRTVLTGGTSRLPGLDSLASSVIGSSVRLGRPNLGEGAPPLGPELATAAGLLRVGARSRKYPAIGLPTDATGKVIQWIRQLF